MASATICVRVNFQQTMKRMFHYRKFPFYTGHRKSLCSSSKRKKRFVLGSFRSRDENAVNLLWMFWKYVNCRLIPEGLRLATQLDGILRVKHIQFWFKSKLFGNRLHPNKICFCVEQLARLRFCRAASFEFSNFDDKINAAQSCQNSNQFAYLTEL